MRHTRLCFIHGSRHLDHLSTAEDSALPIFLCMKQHGITAELILDLFHGFLHRGRTYRSHLHLDSHHPEDLNFNILFDFRV